MPNPGEIKYCELLGGRDTNAAFVFIPPGSFWMGDRSQVTNPVHFVTISKGFWLQQTPLTTVQAHYTISGLKHLSNKPVEMSWRKSIEFIRFTSSSVRFRLPTDAEWEYAARAGVAHKYKHAGSNIELNVAWLQKNSTARGMPVAQLKANMLGLFDLNGNINEWCFDNYDALNTKAQVDPKDQETNQIIPKVTRGGCTLNEKDYATVYDRGADSQAESKRIGVRFVWES